MAIRRDFRTHKGGCIFRLLLVARHSSFAMSDDGGGARAAAATVAAVAAVQTWRAVGLQHSPALYDGDGERLRARIRRSPMARRHAAFRLFVCTSRLLARSLVSRHKRQLDVGRQ